MPYPKHTPVSEDEMIIEPIGIEHMDRHRFDGHHTICQTLRDIYRITNDEEIKLKTRLCMAMAKAMHEKLKEYRNKEAKDL